MTENNISNNNDNDNSNSNNNRILIVDDEADITISFSLALEDNGFKVDAFNDPIQALSSFKNSVYNLVLIDYKMPKMNGYELYQEIRKIDDKVKICFITAFDVYHGEFKKSLEGSNTIHQKEEESDIECFIQKPIDIDELVKQVRKELNS
jgi:DNA-binding NtrC family response regulator